MAITCAVGTIAAAAAAAWFWQGTATRLAPLEPGWDAVTVTLAASTSGPGGRRIDAELSDPFGVAAAPDGSVFVADAGDAPRILRIAADGDVHIIAGGVRGFADGAGASARFDTPSALAIDKDGVLFVADTGNHAIRRVTPDGTVSTLAGDGLPGDADAQGRLARFNGPIGVAVDGRGRVIVADTYNDRVRAIAPDGTVTTIAGGAGAGDADGASADARFDTPCGVAVDAAGEVYVADTGNGTLRRIDLAGVVTTLAREVLSSTGTALRPIGIARTPGGTLFVGDERGHIVEMAPDLQSRILAGGLPGFHDGTGSEARFRRIAGVTLAGEGRLVVADPGNHVIRLVSARSRAPQLVPPPPDSRPAFDATAFARTPLPWPIAPMDGPFEVAGTMGEARGSEGNERFHAGIDVRIDEGTWVRAVRDGTVTTPMATGDFGSLNEWLRIGAVGYIHVRVGRARNGELIDDRFLPGFDDRGKVARIRVRRGTRFAAGETIASVNPFNHVHLNVGPPGEEVNPLALGLPFFEDRIPPTIAAGGIVLYDEAWQPIVTPRRQPPVVSGRIRIVADAWDQADGNRPNRRLGLYSLGYEVLNADGTAAPGFEDRLQTLEFNRLAVQPDAARLVYAPGSGIPFYRGRRTRFLYIVTNTFRDGAAAEGFWDTTAVAPGTYTIRVHARDVRGNEAVGNRDLKVSIKR